MRYLRRVVLTSAVLVFLGSAPLTAKADAVVIGGVNSPPNSFPFGFNVASTAPFYRGTYQQLYARASFAPLGLVAITQIAFASSTLSGPSTAIYDLTVSLGTAQFAASAPAANFAANRGSDFTTVFAGPLAAVLSGRNEFDLVIDFATPFIYDPRLGDLLFDVAINPVDSSTGSLFFVAGTSNQTSRVYNSFGDPNDPRNFVTRQTNFGLYTRINAAPIPEPASLLLLGTGIAGVAAHRRRHRSQTGSTT